MQLCCWKTRGLPNSQLMIRIQGSLCSFSDLFFFLFIFASVGDKQSLIFFFKSMPSEKYFFILLYSNEMHPINKCFFYINILQIDFRMKISK